MPITPLNDNTLVPPPDNGVAPIPPNTSPSNQTATISTIKRDSSQQQLQQLQQYTQQQQNQTVTNQSQPLAKAQLVCRPNSHPFPVSLFHKPLIIFNQLIASNSFQSRTLLLEPNKPVKIGRAIARTRVSDSNAIFDCKVLSRNHAELWYEEGKFYLKVSKAGSLDCSYSS